MNSVVGTSVPRKEGRAKVTGTATYVDDLQFPNLLHGVTVRSRVARGKLIATHCKSGIPWHEFTIVCAADIPGKNCISLIMDDQPCLVETFINHPEEPILLLGHPDKYLLEEARRSIQFEVEPLRSVLTLEDSMEGNEVSTKTWFGTKDVWKILR